MSDFTLIAKIDSLPAGERWNVCHRLQQLSISCQCPADGCLCVQINCSCEIALLCMTVFQCTGSRKDHLAWLERCWQLSTLPIDSGG